MNEREAIKALSHADLCARCAEMGLPSFRVKQIEQWLWEKGAASFDDMTNLSKQLRADLQERFVIDTPTVELRQESADGTRKYLFAFADGVSVESVGIPSADGTRLTVCFSTQAGCAMNCSFCATGQAGFTRNLHAGEMFDQVRLVGADFGTRVTNVVAMGQGEPFANYDATMGALRRMNSKVGLGIGARHITVSTCGLLPGIERFTGEPEQFTLAVSLHSAVQETRDALMPGIKGMKLDELKEVLKVYGDLTKRRPSLEYAPIDGVNDDDEHLFALIAFCSGMLSHVNLIPLNPITPKQQAEGMLRSSPRIIHFESVLSSKGIEVSIRQSRGTDIDGACGQLRQSALAGGA